MRVGHCVLLSGALWLLAEQLTEAHAVHPITEAEYWEEKDCLEFHLSMVKWKKNRLALNDHVIILNEVNKQLFERKKYYRNNAQNTFVIIGLASAAKYVFAGRLQAALVCLWAGLFCMCASDYGVKSYYERPIHELIFMVSTMAEEDMRLQRKMLTQLCDDPPFVGLDETAKILLFCLEQIRPPSWLDHNIDVDQPSEAEVKKTSQRLLSVWTQLHKKLDYPIDPPKTAARSPEEMAAIQKLREYRSDL